MNTHKHAPWRKAVLIPFWTVQLLFEMLLIGVLALAENILVHYDDYYDSDTSDVIAMPETSTQNAEHTIVPVWIAFIAVCLILTITEIILLARQKLKPSVFVIMNVIKTVIFTVMFVLDMVSAFSVGGRTSSFIGVVIDLILLVCFWVPLIYGSVILHRTRTRAVSYKPVTHPQQNPMDGPIEYPAQYRGFVQEQGQDVEANRAPGERRLSYNNRRGTRFDSYKESYTSPVATPQGSYGNASGLASSDMGIPTVNIEHHDAPEVYIAPTSYSPHQPGTYEMDKSRRPLV